MKTITLKTITLALVFAFSAPAFAGDAADAAKDVSDAVKDTVDTAKDKLGTDSGGEKVGRHVDRAVRTVKHKARHAKNAVKDEVHEATK